MTKEPRFRPRHFTRLYSWQMHEASGWRASAVVVCAALTLLPAVAFASGSGEGTQSSDADGAVVVDYRGRRITITDSSRIVPIGGAITEIVFALGAGDSVVGIDTSATFPPEATALPIVGYQRRITAEGVLKVQPTLVIATTEAAPTASFRLLRHSGVTVLVLEEEFTVVGTHDKIGRIGVALGREREAEAVSRQLDVDLAAAAELVSASTSRPRVLFVYARGRSVLMAAGRNNQASQIMELAGVDNAGDRFLGFRPLTAEAVVAADPQVLLMMTAGMKSIGGVEGALELPGVALTDAGRQRRIVHLEDNYLLGFGPRLGLVVRDLVLAIHPELRR